MSQVTIKLVVDVIGALENGSLAGNLYAFDTNRRAGSQDNGTDALHTAVTRGTHVTWMIATLECEAFVEIDDIKMDAALCEPERKSFPGSSIIYWSGRVKKTPQDANYDLVLNVGTHGRRMVHSATLALIPTEKTSEKGQAQ